MSYDYMSMINACVIVLVTNVLRKCLYVRVWLGCVCFQAEDGIRDLVRSRGLGDVYKRQDKDKSCLTR